MKRCTKCGDEKSEEAFAMQPSRGYRRAVCRECKAQSDKEWFAKRKINPPKPKSETKRCKECQEVKPISEFSPGSPGYFHPRCHACEKAIKQEKRREQYRNDPTGRFYWPFVNEAGIRVKRCTYCHAEKATSEFYTNRPGRLHGKCKDCDKAIRQANYDANPEKYRSASLESTRRHPDRARASHQRWYNANQEYYVHYHREYNTANRERYLTWHRIRHIRDHEQELVYRRTHRYEASERASRRRARQRNAPRIEGINRRALIERDKWTCYVCGIVCTPKNVTLDHVVPLFRGGSHTADNLRVACFSCNSSKGTKYLHEFLK